MVIGRLMRILPPAGESALVGEFPAAIAICPRRFVLRPAAFLRMLQAGGDGKVRRQRRLVALVTALPLGAARHSSVAVSSVARRRLDASTQGP